jgi:hypothetical protein
MSGGDVWVRWAPSQAAAGRERVTAMLRARRLASVVSVAVVGALALGACGRADPGVAAFVGQYKITENQVTDITDEARHKVVPVPVDPQNPQATPVKAPTREQVVSILVLGEVCRRLSADKGYQPQGQVSPDQLAPKLGLTADATYARRSADLRTCLSGVPVQEPAAATPQELADVVAAGRAGGIIPAEVSDAEAAQRLNGEQLNNALAIRKALAAAVGAYDLTINPRYRPLEFPVLAFNSDVPAVSVPLGEDDDAVTDLPSSAAPETPAP